MKKYVIGLIAIAVLTSVVALGWHYTQKEPVKDVDRVQVENQGDTPKTEDPEPVPDYSLTDLDSPWLVVNKQNKLPADYVPNDLVVPDVELEGRNPESELRLRKEAATHLEQLFAAADEDNINMQLASGYRPYETQSRFYTNAGGSSQVGVAPPGASEHQAGLAADIRGPSDACRISRCFEDQPAGKWLAKNAYKYGFILRYPDGKMDVTGYKYEPWHFRYVGEYLAEEIHKQNTTLEEYFEITGQSLS